MKHVHYDKIVAKAENMDLVLFIKVEEQWQATGCHDNQIINIASHYDYFLCLPQHKEACLHWLNGGEIQVRDFVTSPFSDVIEWSKDWTADGCGFMVEGWIIRIKPKKEKRWIAYTKDQKRVGVLTFDSEQAIKCHYGDEADSFHEIEVEV